MLLYTAWHSQSGVEQFHTDLPLALCSINTNLQIHCSSCTACTSSCKAGRQHPPEDTNGDYLSHTHTETPVLLQPNTMAVGVGVLQLRQVK